MSANYPVLPIASGTPSRVFTAALTLVTYWFKRMMRARRHRREANVLAGLDRHMLADIGITRADLRDAFSEPFWEDPTTLLRERALERRVNRPIFRAPNEMRVENGFHRPSTDRPARQAM
jgi:uncharacterized protein YjiS (DUF1127 family)